MLEFSKVNWIEVNNYIVRDLIDRCFIDGCMAIYPELADNGIKFIARDYSGDTKYGYFIDNDGVLWSIRADGGMLEIEGKRSVEHYLGNHRFGPSGKLLGREYFHDQLHLRGIGEKNNNAFLLNAGDTRYLTDRGDIEASIAYCLAKSIPGMTYRGDDLTMDRLQSLKYLFRRSKLPICGFMEHGESPSINDRMISVACVLGYLEPDGSLNHNFGASSLQSDTERDGIMHYDDYKFACLGQMQLLGLRLSVDGHKEIFFDGMLEAKQGSKEDFDSGRYKLTSLSFAGDKLLYNFSESYKRLGQRLYQRNIYTNGSITEAYDYTVKFIDEHIKVPHSTSYDSSKAEFIVHVDGLSQDKCFLKLFTHLDKVLPTAINARIPSSEQWIATGNPVCGVDFTMEFFSELCKAELEKQHEIQNRVTNKQQQKVESNEPESEKQYETQNTVANKQQQRVKSTELGNRKKTDKLFGKQKVPDGITEMRIDTLVNDENAVVGFLFSTDKGKFTVSMDMIFDMGVTYVSTDDDLDVSEGSSAIDLSSDMSSCEKLFKVAQHKKLIKIPKR